MVAGGDDKKVEQRALEATRQLSKKPPSSIRVLVAGATGYIGRFVVQQFVNEGYQTTALVRPGSAVNERLMEGATVKRAEVTDEESLTGVFADGSYDVVVSCLASRSGVKSDAYAVDYQATLNLLEAARRGGAKHFVLLSAFCVNKPVLQFQFAKLKFEAALQGAKDITHSIVRPTAFFKSLSGQLETLDQGWPFIMFGDGSITRCNPISEPDLAAFMVSCVKDPAKWNAILSVGGPDGALTMRDQGNMMFDALGKEPKFWTFPLSTFDPIIGAFAFLGRWFPQMEDAAELGRIGKYYAEYDMLTTAPGEIYGGDTLQEHYSKIAREGQEYDPFTTMFAKKKQPAAASKEAERQVETVR
ncbi:unnamed protein product [Vitrella brassicaformis CCMP3155]|uniref:Divinyl chlorophyllide a 8-vinyl-reductase, chloroplastic n=1 Tax=Vitrella brassicaformis (strain CCMP3155) TaxID=1169540 RepID=A0A0G4F228_VITBC|nr:unnamed protein product [Vitrella brassicaformis CCMP3155]|eukprot:CEM05584.1 unnamed protein product [Vitrella brassicaformis CCMP3155]